MLGDGGWGLGSSGITAHLSLHQDLLGLRIHHVVLMSLHKLLLRQPDMFHGVSEEVSADLLFLLYHVHNEILVLVSLLPSK